MAFAPAGDRPAGEMAMTSEVVVRPTLRLSRAVVRPRVITREPHGCFSCPDPRRHPSAGDDSLGVIAAFARGGLSPKPARPRLGHLGSCHRRKMTQDLRELRRYRRRWLVERLFSWLLNFRRLVTRYEYRVNNYLALCKLGCIAVLLRRI